MKVIEGNFSDQNKKKKSPMQKINQDTPVIHAEEGNYSIMLLDLIKPYTGENPTADKLEEMIQIGMLAWNLSISKSLGMPGHNEVSKSAILEAGFNKNQVEILKKIEAEKLKKLPEHTIFIESYELTEDSDSRMSVNITVIPIADMLMGGMGFDEDDSDNDDFDENEFPFEDADEAQYEEGIVNRSAFSLKHKPAFIEWAKKANKNPELIGNVIYLIEEKDSEEEANIWLKKNYKELMEGELEEVTINLKKWPKLTYSIFCDFFEVQFHSMIWDSVKEPIDKF